MRNNLFVLMVAIVMAFGFSSCTDETIGSSISDIRSDVIADSSFSITGKSVRNEHLRSRSSIQLLGKVNAEGYGALTSDVVTQFMPSSVIDTVGVHGGSEWIDSCFVTMRVATGDFIGDSITPMRMDIYELNKQLPSPIYSDFNPSGYYSTGGLMGSTSYSASEMAKKTVSNANGTISSYYEINVPVSVEYARNFFNEFKNNPSTFSSPQEFAQFFPGIYIANSYGQGRVMNFYDIEFVTYYRKYEKLTETTDTIYPAQKQSYLAVTPEVIYNNNITLVPDANVLAMVNNGDAVVMGPAGYEVQVDFPIQDIIDKFKKDTKDGIGVINALSLELPVEAVTNKYDIAPPEYLLMVKESYRDNFFDQDTLVNNKDAFYAMYDALGKCYKFTGLRDYVLDILNNKGGVAPVSDKKFVIMPIDVTMYTNTSSYYSTTTSQVITKIAPAVSRPSIAKLTLDKAIIRLEYSKQTVY